MKFLSIFITFIFIASCSSSQVSNIRYPSNYMSDINCSSFVEQLNTLYQRRVYAERTAERLKGRIRFPKGEVEEGRHIMFGFESEYTKKETGKLLRQYMPDTLMVSKESWLEMSDEGRLEYLLDRKLELLPSRKMAPFKKIAENEDLKNALPDSIVYDSGNFEIVLPPSDTAEDLLKKIKIINREIGTGSMQVTVSRPERTVVNKENFINSELGYLNFVNEFDTLKKLHKGYLRYAADQNVLAAKSFNHPWLGPMIKQKHTRLKELIERSSNGHKMNEDEIKEVGLYVTSSKFIGGTVYRPEIAAKQKRLAYEVRDCHRDIDCIYDRIKRETYILSEGKDKFSDASALIPFDSKGVYDGLPKQMKAMLKAIFPKHANFGQLELQLFRNFSYPLRDWSSHFIYFSDFNGLEAQVKEAQKAYLDKLKVIESDLSNEIITEDEARKRVMGALAEFSEESGLYKAFEQKYQNFIKDMPREIKRLTYLTYYHLKIS